MPARLEAEKAQIVATYVEDLPPREQRVAVRAVVLDDRRLPAIACMPVASARNSQLAGIAAVPRAAVDFLQADGVAIHFLDDIGNPLHVTTAVRAHATMDVVRADVQRLVLRRRRQLLRRDQAGCPLPQP